MTLYWGHGCDQMLDPSCCNYGVTEDQSGCILEKILPMQSGIMPESYAKISGLSILAKM